MLQQDAIHKAVQVAYDEALKAYHKDEVPVGSCIIYDKQIIAQQHNQVFTKNNPTAHAEIESIRSACYSLNTPYLEKSIMVTTLEPCTLCTGAIILSRIKEVYFLAYADKIPGIRQVMLLAGHNHKLNYHKLDIKNLPYSSLLKKFFLEKRQSKK